MHLVIAEAPGDLDGKAVGAGAQALAKIFAVAISRDFDADAVWIARLSVEVERRLDREFGGIGILSPADQRFAVSLLKGADRGVAAQAHQHLVGLDQRHVRRDIYKAVAGDILLEVEVGVEGRRGVAKDIRHTVDLVGAGDRLADL